ncbi:hypothetical protein Ddc_24143 [Ditylenchus destructor]|nr:hypothetical protein Ddc_24143 [Ditylenchus destructor]
MGGPVVWLRTVRKSLARPGGPATRRAVGGMDCSDRRQAGGVPRKRPAEAGLDQGREALLLDRLDLDHDPLLFLGEAVGHAVIGAEHGAVEGGLEVAAADFTLEHRVLVAVEVVGLQRHGRGLALERQLAVDGRHLVAAEVELRADELGGRELRVVEDLGALQVAVELGEAGVDAVHVDGDLDLAGLAPPCPAARCLPSCRSGRVGARCRSGASRRWRRCGSDRSRSWRLRLGRPVTAIREASSRAFSWWVVLL